MTPSQTNPKLAMSMSWTVQVEQFSPLQIFVSVSDVDIETPSEAIEELMGSKAPEVANLLQKALVGQMKAKLAALRGQEPPEEEPAPKVFKIFGHTIKGKFPSNANWRSPMSPSQRSKLATEWKRYDLTMTQIAACEKGILAQADEVEPATGLLMGQAWLITTFLQETAADKTATCEMLAHCNVEELEKPLEGNDLAEAIGEVFGSA